MQLFLGWILIIFPGLLYIGQIISSVNFPLAQKIGLQENPDHADKLLQRSERYTAYWDVVTLCWLPVSGMLMVIDYQSWPIFALVGGAVYFDTAGREAAKILSLKHEGVSVGAPRQFKLFFSTYIIMAALGITTIAYSVGHIWVDR